MVKTGTTKIEYLGGLANGGIWTTNQILIWGVLQVDEGDPGAQVLRLRCRGRGRGRNRGLSAVVADKFERIPPDFDDIAVQ